MNTWRAVEHVMGMPISVALRGRHAGDAVAVAAWDAVIAELRQVDAVFSTYRPDSVISRLGRAELDLAACPPEVAEVLDLAEQARIESAGAFEIRLAAVAAGVPLDPSGVVKGWAVQRAARHLARLDDTDHCLSAGGDMVCHVAAPGRPSWRIGIEDPHAPERLVARLPVRSAAVATSGATHRGTHIVDPRTGRPPVGIASVTVVAATLTWADIDATAAYAHGADALDWLRTRPGRTGLVVWADGTTDTFRGRPRSPQRHHELV